MLARAAPAGSTLSEGEKRRGSPSRCDVRCVDTPERVGHTMPPESEIPSCYKTLAVFHRRLSRVDSPGPFGMLCAGVLVCNEVVLFHACRENSRFPAFAWEDAGENSVPKVLIADKLSPEGIEILEAADGLEVLNKPGMSPEELLEIIPDIDGLVIRSGCKVTAEVIAAATKLKVVGRAGIGVDNVDIPAATERGIVVMNTPFGNNITTAEHAVALIVSLARHIPPSHGFHEGRQVGEEQVIRLGIV